MSEISDICDSYFVSFGVQLIAASCAGNLTWMKALLRVGADVNENITSDKNHKLLTAFYGCLAYAPEETRVEGLKLLIANKCVENMDDITRKFPYRQLYTNGMFDIMEWLGISDRRGEQLFDTDLQRAARHCDHERMEVSTRIMAIHIDNLLMVLKRTDILALYYAW